ncbi:MAG: M23 family metallopeptidase [Zymomonas mobilis subsp. pomaceae]|uniref:Peptidase M23 n=1 Tax=Zymomonas mobilis subsp. pomaceae (strain ATCC 29192 / DSM 22645 / JCM 10191 / CCUG 17912 / NBRC 13757 / NCIMB 11200 / NRRL B-4491 / Barker I) TaxID=579138 RepID=F8EWE1_ZYMMT|nr:M23 family metallopeptidase [Zymomonas mobilis]AEI38551.1 Peptidase M23 [Zymomonas mobilis subsp. pomaceae ATCC 29192]MDX5948241.1 M23 family metallopeptidase [Zymomonas mobilis subsp. pomaceae]GEB88996.1 hypothetical protein ZMO02_06330 [Zymomonas mobilis subsp. pomaceae]
MIVKASVVRDNNAANVVYSDNKIINRKSNSFWFKLSLLAVMVSTPALASKHAGGAKSNTSHTTHAVTAHTATAHHGAGHLVSAHVKTPTFHTVAHPTQFSKIYSRNSHFSSARYEMHHTASHYKMAHFVLPHRSYGFQPIAIDPTTSTVPAIAETPSHGDKQYHNLFVSWAKADDTEINNQAAVVPSSTPLGSRFALTSPFGVRADPFRRHAAMHTGIDMAAPYGTPVYASADGVVDRAGQASGYGNLIEIDHGHTIQTRYGHLSRILVSEGQTIKRGDLIGLMGSSGRSTGSHLHYEVRIQGEAVNPVPFLAVDSYHMAMLENVSSGAQGGPEKDIRDVKVRHKHHS